MVTEPDAQQHHTVLFSPPDDVNAVHDLLQRVWADSPKVEELERLRFETALVELSGNVFEHANDGSGLQCSLEITVRADRLIAVVEDTGVPLASDIGPREMPGEYAESGRGMSLIHALVDELTYERDDDTNRWQMVRNLPNLTDYAEV